MRSWVTTFPSGWSALGLLLLRLVLGILALGQGSICIASSVSWMSLAGAAILIPCGICVLIGFFTSITSLALAAAAAVISSSLVALPSARLLDCMPARLELIVISLAVAMLGPGFFSLDARLFGRREIIIPPSTRSKQS